ncbi:MULTISPECIES: glycerophosphodiester phosphodiesterase [Virgibacillus]|uniref:Glycerophosphoryl diester phosphodiesterase n=2 Tax=Virgibacillus TaxID=84406 RepID=A0A024QCQ0_9BACI|nr:MULTISPECIES: glycerophosphodiester phosphodiesterase family protein [Virgibacillus]EQB36037.1 hypothetical protein M948_13455 [Virgibacillus sp. CM-4]MYL41901.1 glycerophosphodiester phosphodiesterase [Virgibacillus massiliensis]CDQ39731.1 Glycerophosphoryl diester phosphodiesterase [Virgibacillus massiliensis]
MNTKIFAHRGASKYAPENTMPAFKLACNMNADGIETDVQLTKDNIPVLFHDEQLKRTTGTVGYVKDFTYEQLKQLDAGRWYSNEFEHITIPSLDDFLNWIKAKPLYLNIELKNYKIDYKHIESIVYDAIAYHQLLNRTTISTFNPNSIRRLRNKKDTIGVAFLTSKKYKRLVSFAEEMGANAIHIKYRLLNKRLVEESHRRNMKLRVYTVNKPARIIRSLETSVNGIITDVPDQAIHCKKIIKE